MNNPTGELLPGAYASVHLKMAGESARALTIPANTLLFRSEGLRVAVVRDGKVQLIPIKIGRDFGESLEVLAGLTRGGQTDSERAGFHRFGCGRANR